MFGGRGMRGMRAWLPVEGGLGLRTCGDRGRRDPGNLRSPAPHPVSAGSWKALLSPPQPDFPRLLWFMAFLLGWGQIEGEEKKKPPGGGDIKEQTRNPGKPLFLKAGRGSCRTIWAPDRSIR